VLTTQFTCFTRSIVQILTPEKLLLLQALLGFTSTRVRILFTRTKVQILTETLVLQVLPGRTASAVKERWHSVHNLLALLVIYWYKSTNTDAKGAARQSSTRSSGMSFRWMCSQRVRNLLALRVQEYKY
jgi:cation transporter-like permease